MSIPSAFLPARISASIVMMTTSTRMTGSTPGSAILSLSITYRLCLMIIAKYLGVIRKLYSQIGLIKKNGVWMPVDPQTHKTIDYCFIDYNTPQEAELAKEITNGYKLDKAHMFAVNMFDDFDRFVIGADEWAPPAFKP